MNEYEVKLLSTDGHVRRRFVIKAASPEEAGAKVLADKLVEESEDYVITENRNVHQIRRE